MAQQGRTARDLARRSQAAVGAKDRAAWLGLFTPDAVVQDPVGPSPFDARDGTSRTRGHRGVLRHRYRAQRVDHVRDRALVPALPAHPASRLPSEPLPSSK